MAGLTQRTALATFWSALEIAARYSAQFVVMIVLARLLTPSDFGLMAMLLVFTTVGALLVDAGFGIALVQRQHTTDDDETTAFVTSLGAGIALAIVLWITAPRIAQFYSQPILTPLMRLSLFVLPLGALAAVPDALLTQRMDFRSRATAEIVAALCSGVVAIVMAWHGFGVWSLAWQGIVAIGLRTVALWVLAGWRPRGRFDAACFRRLFGFGGFMLLANLMNALSVRLQSLLIGRLYDSSALGYYTLAQNVQQAPAQFMSGVLNRVGLPVFSSLVDQPAKLIGALRLSLRVSIFVFLPCMVGIAVVAKSLITVVFGARWVSAAPLLSVLSIAAAFWPLHVLNLAAIGARGRSDLIFKLEIAKQVVSIVLIVLASFHSMMMIAFALLASSLFSSVINTWYSHNLFGYGMLAQLRDQTAAFVLTAVSSAVAWLASHWVSNPSIALAMAVMAAVVTYFGTAALCRVTAWRELLDVLRGLMSRNTVPASPAGDIA